MIFTLLVLNIHAQTICIRIRCENKIRIMLLRKCKGKLKGFCRLRIRIADSRKLSIRKLLLRNDIYILKAEFTKNSAGRDITCTM